LAATAVKWSIPATSWVQEASRWKSVFLDGADRGTCRPDQMVLRLLCFQPLDYQDTIPKSASRFSDQTRRLRATKNETRTTSIYCVTLRFAGALETPPTVTTTDCVPIPTPLGT
jgi:hypothetical protein